MNKLKLIALLVTMLSFGQKLNAITTIICYKGANNTTDCYIRTDAKCDGFDPEMYEGMLSCTEIYLIRPTIFIDKLGQGFIVDKGKSYKIAPDKLIKIIDSKNNKDLKAYFSSQNKELIISAKRIEEMAKSLNAKIFF